MPAAGVPSGLTTVTSTASNAGSVSARPLVSAAKSTAAESVRNDGNCAVPSAVLTDSDAGPDCTSVSVNAPSAPVVRDVAALFAPVHVTVMPSTGSPVAVTTVPDSVIRSLAAAGSAGATVTSRTAAASAARRDGRTTAPPGRAARGAVTQTVASL